MLRMVHVVCVAATVSDYTLLGSYSLTGFIVHLRRLFDIELAKKHSMQIPKQATGMNKVKEILQLSRHQWA